MDVEDVVIWVNGPDDDGLLAFTALGVEILVELIKTHRKSTPTKSAEINDERRPAAANPGRLLRIWMKFVNNP